jgi:hypothetical protein
MKTLRILSCLVWVLAVFIACVSIQAILGNQVIEGVVGLIISVLLAKIGKSMWFDSLDMFPRSQIQPREW